MSMPSNLQAVWDMLVLAFQQFPILGVLLGTAVALFVMSMAFMAILDLVDAREGALTPKEWFKNRFM